MKLAIIIVVIVSTLHPPVDCIAQGSVSFPKLYRQSRRTNTIADPVKAIQEIESILPKISTNNKIKFLRLRFILSLRLADLYLRTGAYGNAENLLLSMTAEVRKT